MVCPISQTSAVSLRRRNGSEKVLGGTFSVAYGLRSYSPLLGRWVNRDPIGERGGMHLLSFVSNQPLHFIDSFGNCSACFSGDCELDALIGDEFEALSGAIADTASDAADAASCAALGTGDISLAIIGNGIGGIRRILSFFSILPPGMSFGFPPSYPVSIWTPNGPVVIDVGAILNAVENFGPALDFAMQKLEDAVDATRDEIEQKKKEQCCDE